MRQRIHPQFFPKHCQHLGYHHDDLSPELIIGYNECHTIVSTLMIMLIILFAEPEHPQLNLHHLPLPAPNLSQLQVAVSHFQHHRYIFSSSTNLNKNSPDFNQNKVCQWILNSCKFCMIVFRWQPCPTTVNTSFQEQSWIFRTGIANDLTEHNHGFDDCTNDRMDLSSPTEQRQAVDAAYDEIFPMPGRWQLIDLVAFVLVRSTIQRSHLGRPLGLVWFAWFGLLYFDWLVYLLLQDLPDPLHQGHLGRQQRGCLRHLHLEFNIVFRIFFLRPWNKKTPRQVQPSFLGLLFKCDFHSVL